MFDERTHDPEGWLALGTKQPATCTVIHWTDACAATCIGIDSPTLYERFLAQQVGDLHLWTQPHMGACAGGVSTQLCMGYTSTTCDLCLENGILINTIANIRLIHIECVDNTHLDTHQQHIKHIKIKHTPTMQHTIIHIQHTNQTMSNTPNMRIRFLFDPT